MWDQDVMGTSQLFIICCNASQFVAGLCNLELYDDEDQEVEEEVENTDDCEINDDDVGSV